MQFYKFQASGNDFLVVERRHLPPSLPPGVIARRLCDRHFGAGGDGLLVLEGTDAIRSERVHMRVYNADGSEAEISGNGLRCVAGYVYQSGGRDRDITIMTRAGGSRLRLLEARGSTLVLEAEMGRPRMASRDIPMSLEPPQDHIINYPLRVGERVVQVTACSMGNPHCSLIMGGTTAFDVSDFGPQIENHPTFPERTNVEFVTVLSRERIKVWFWERGVGETLSSGTGSCAAVVATVLNELTDRRVDVVTRAGELAVHWRDDNVIVLAGPVELVYKGEWLKDLW